MIMIMHFSFGSDGGTTACSKLTNCLTVIPVFLGEGLILGPKVFVQNMDFSYSRENGR